MTDSAPPPPKDMTRREYYAAHAPVTLACARAALGPLPKDAAGRADFLLQWAQLRHNLGLAMEIAGPTMIREEPPKDG